MHFDLGPHLVIYCNSKAAEKEMLYVIAGKCPQSGFCIISLQ